MIDRGTGTRLSGAALAALLCACAGSRPLPGAGNPILYVSSAGSDRSDGSFARPLRTIERCATTAKPGQTCYVRGGTYRETLHPNNGIAIRPFPGETVRLVATQRVVHWKRSSGSIYSASVTIPPGLPAGQVFLGSAMTPVSEAQWPVPARDPMHPNWGVEAAGSSEKTIVDPHLPAGDLAGAYVNVWSGEDPWTHVTGVVTSSGGGRLAFEPDSDGCPWFCSMPKGFYYVTGARALLLGPNEWWYDVRKKNLDLWAPGSVDPNALDVEVKVRGVLIDLSGRSGVTIAGLHLYGGGIVTSATSSGNTIDGVVALYPSNVLHGNNSYYTYQKYPQESGIVLDGTHELFENGTVAYSAANGIIVLGRDNTVTNTLVHDVDSIGDYSAGVLPITGHAVITHDTIFNTGRAAITFGPVPAVEVGYDDLHDAMLLAGDGGELYACCMTQSAGTRVHDNWVHSELSPRGRLPGSNTCPCPWAGIYVDNGLGGIEVDHNVVWHNYPGIFVHGQAHYPTDRVHVDDNTLSSKDQSSIWLLNLAGFADTEVSNNRIGTPIQTDATSKHVPQTNNSPTAPGAGAIGRPGCNFAGCS